MKYQTMRCGVALVQYTGGSAHREYNGAYVWYGEAEWPSRSFWLVPSF